MLTWAGLDSSKYGLHSPRSGATTEAFKLGVDPLSLHAKRNKSVQFLFLFFICICTFYDWKMVKLVDYILTKVECNSKISSTMTEKIAT